MNRVMLPPIITHMTTRLSFLGPARITVAAQDAELTSGKGLALLAYLAGTGAPQTRDHLCDLLWAESHPDAARKNLRNTLWRVRQTVGEDAVITHDDMLLLAGSVWTDVAAFEAGLQAQSHRDHPTPDDRESDQLDGLLHLWRGPLLAGVNLTDAPDFALWLSSERARLGQLYGAGLNLRLAQHRAAARWQDVVTVARQALAHDSTQESIHACLMEAYAQLGQRTAALRQYDTLRTILEQEVGATPLPQTHALRQSILAGTHKEDGVSTGTASTGTAPIDTRPPRPRPPIRRPFVGRAAEQLTLDEIHRRAIDGRLQIALISGETGMGKSTLWQQWSHRLAPGASVLEARCLHSTQTLPFAPLTGLFDTQSSLARLARLQSPSFAVWLTELTRLFPHIRDFRPDLPAAIPVPPQEERRRLLEALAQTLRALTTDALVLFIDDLHWADQATLDWLTYLTDRLGEEPVLLVCAYRATDAPPAVEQQIARWSRDAAVQRISLAPLSFAESTALVHALHSRQADWDEAMIQHLHTQSGGNPYYLTELARVYPESTPAPLVDLLDARLVGVPDNALRLLQIAAILEPTISFEMLHQVSRQTEDDTLDALDDLLEIALLVEKGERYEFAQPLLARIVRDKLSAPRRKRLHRDVAEQLRVTFAADLDHMAGQLAHHFAAAGNDTEAARYAERAAEQATQIGAVVEAANFYRQAYALDPTPDRQLELAHALMQVPGGVEEARHALQQAFEELEASQDQKGIAKAGLRLAFSFLSTEEGEEVLYWAERIQGLSAPTDSVDVQATIEYLMAAGNLHRPNAMAEADRHYSEATRLAAAPGVDAAIAIQSWFSWGNLSVQHGDYAAARAKFQHALEISHAAGNVYFEGLCYNNLAHAALLAGDLTDARTTINTGLNFIEKNALMRPRQYHYSTRGEVALTEGSLDEAEWWFTQALDEANVYDNDIHAVNVRANLGRVAQARGDYAQAEKLLRAALDDLSPGSARFLRVQIELWLAELSLVRGEVAAAAAQLEAARTGLASSPRRALQASADQLARRIARR